MSQTSRVDREVPTRRISFEASLQGVPRHFAAGGDLVLSHVAASLSAVFPDGEDFFVRSVRHFRPQVTDPDLRRQVAGFIGQANLWPCRVRGADGDGLVLDALGTTLGSAAGETRIEAGRDATLMVRPERVRVSVDKPPATDGGAAAVEATVTDLTFQGPLVRLSLAAAGGAPIVAQLGHDVELPLLRPGDTVWAGWPSAASLVLPAADIPTPEDLEEMFDEG